MSPDPVAVTSESDWLERLARGRFEPPDIARWSRVVVVAAHPDDESLGVGGFLQVLCERDIEVRLVVATDGEAAFPALDQSGRERLARIRRKELEAALRVQALGHVPVTWIALPDSALTDCERELARTLRPLLANADVSIVPWPRDPHPDHQAAGRAAMAATPPETEVWSYPIWMWHWMRPEDAAIPWNRTAVQRLGPERRARKSAAMAELVSQTSSGADGQGPILPPQVLAHFERDVEVLFEESP